MLRKRALLLSLGIALGFLGCSGDESPTGPASPSAAQEGQAGGNGVDGALGDGASSSGSDSAVTVSGDGEEATARRASAGSAQADSVVPDQYIVILKPHVANRFAAADQLVGAHALTMRRNFRHALRGFAAKVPPSRLKALKRHPLVEMVVPNTVLREGGSFSGLAALGSMTAPGLMAAPEEVPGLGLRLRLVADELLGTVGDGGEVSVWPNLGSEADAAQADGTKRPTLHAGSSGLFGGHAHVGFNESTDNDEVLEVAGVVPHGSATVIAVFAQDDAYRHHYGVAGFYGNATDRVSIMTRRYRAGPDRLSYWDRTSGWKESGFVVRAGDPHIGVWRIDGSAQVDFQVDGESEGSAAMSSDIHGGWDRYLVGAPQPATAERFDGQVAELLVWDRVLSDCERDDVVSKLGARYGISVPVTGGLCIPPAAPSGLGAVASGFTGIDLSWLDGSIDEDGFSIERRLGTEGDEAFAEIAQVGPDVESYFNGGLASETEYCYRVAAFNTNGTSDYSNTACVTTGTISVPPPEEVPGLGLRLRLVADELLGTVGDGGEVSVWPNLGSEADAAQADGTKRPTLHAGSSGLFGGHAHVGFNESTDNDEVLEVAGVVPHGSATVIAVFAQDDAYRHHYGVAGFYGNATDRVSIMTRRYRAGPDRLSYWDRTSGWKESGFVVRAGDPHIGVWRIDGSAQVDFQVDGESEGSAAMSSDIHGGWDRYLVGAPQPATAERFDGQVAELLVWDRVLSDCERDDVVSKLGARYGISVPVTGGLCIPPAAPSGLGAVASGFTGIDLSWLDGSIDEDGFSIERRLGTEGDEAFAEIAQVGPDVESYFNGGLASETEYCYRVAAFNTNGTSDHSNTACATTAQPPPPGSCVDTGGHDTDGGQFDLWHVTKVEADSNPKWQATQVPGCEPTPWLFSLDSGVDSDHPELNVVEIRNFVSAEPGHSGEDGRGHGSHTAGIAAARDGNGGTVGIAPGAPIYGFRVLNDQGAGTTEDAIAAIDEIITRKLASPDQPMVANMSLGGGANEALDVAVREAVSAGVVFTLSAGNGILGLCFLPGDAQNVSPARVGDDDITAAGGSSGDTRRANGAITVTASNQADADINCNYGNPVSVAAPGEDIASTWLNGGYATQTGTSMASPVVAGAAILYLMDHPDASPAEVEQAIIDRLEAWSTNDQPNASGRLSADGL